jgi:hypothetical protein
MNKLRECLMRMFCAALLLTLMLSFSGVLSARAQEPIPSCGNGSCETSPNPDVKSQVGAYLKSYSTTTLHGGYVAHGVGMRNLGYGTINVSDVPPGATVSKAYLFWAIIGPRTMPGYYYYKGKFAGHAITGTLIGSSANPCWGGNYIWGYRATVTSYIIKGGNGNYFLSNFASGKTNGDDPWTLGSTDPMAEGATLVILFNKTGYPNTTIKIYNGMATTVYTQLHQTIAGVNVVAPTGFAYTTFIMADGQSDYDFPDSTRLFFDSLPAVWSGADPNGNGVNYKYGNLWDTVTVDVHKLLEPPEPDFWFSTYDAGELASDCVSWEAQVVATSKGNVDSDGDKFLDNWELNYYNGIDMAAIGADPLHKDLFVEADYMNYGGNLLPPADNLDDAVGMFANAPVSNPDGHGGITLHIDTGGADANHEPGTFSRFDLGGGGPVTNKVNLGADTVGCASYDWSEFQSYKDTYFSYSRLPIFHYMIFAYDLAPCFDGTSGISRNGNTDAVFIKGATDFIVSLGEWGTVHGTADEREGTFIHEFGHNLGLRHGGNDHVNYKPNYLSVMSYMWQTTGIWRDGGWTFDYSRLLLPTLNENSLNEAVGLGPLTLPNGYATKWFCPNHSIAFYYANPWVDWNCNGVKQSGVKADINWKDYPYTPGAYTVLGSQNNWANITFSGNGVIGSGLSLSSLAALALPTTPWVEELKFEQVLAAPPEPAK